MSNTRYFIETYKVSLGIMLIGLLIVVLGWLLNSILVPATQDIVSLIDDSKKLKPLLPNARLAGILVLIGGAALFTYQAYQNKDM
jgi:hypothetical protein